MSSIQQGSDSITAYYNKTHKAWDEIDRLSPTPTCTCNKCTCDLTKKLKDITASNRFIQFLMGLNAEYEVIRGQILNLDPLLGVSKTFNVIARAESEKNVSNLFSTNTVDASALLVKNYVAKSEADSKGGNKKKEAGKKSDRHEGIKKEKGTGGKKAVANMAEAEISQEGSKGKQGEDLASMVSLLIKQEMGKLLKAKQTDEHVNYANLMDFAGNNSNSASDCNMPSIHGCWIIDTGASSHMSSDFNLMKLVTSVNPPIKVHLPDSSTKVVTQKGQACLHPKLTLQNVLIVPSFKFNLLSVNKLARDTGLYLTFHKFHCIVQDSKSRDVIAVAKVKKNLYILEKKSFYPHIIKEVLAQYDSNLHFANHILACNLSSSINESSFSLWHQRLGHCPATVIDKIDSFQIDKSSQIPICDVCHLAKQHRLPFPKSHTKSEKALEKIHVDLWGPYAVPSLTQAHYVLTIVDDYSRVTWTFLLRNKSQVPQTLENFLNQVQKQYEKPVKIIRTDNGTEFLNKDCENIFDENSESELSVLPEPFNTPNLTNSSPSTSSADFSPSNSSTNQSSAIGQSSHTTSTEISQTASTVSPIPRASTRAKNPPAWLNDYVYIFICALNFARKCSNTLENAHFAYVDMHFVSVANAKIGMHSMGCYDALIEKPRLIVKVFP
ncbi:Retrovirus-related Pol polyprotein from transposon TNT 1-94 [Senna tora]|uniref:Retrovirus-related Pol polyprotein from transposon TNT 1-94 n=1 Tax=Senna tora TaxID=362788 RepID=A0A834WIC4_9FABA|nr:Retrovirus-related Pol polyprotein from transposon TNT 1-94 [Senna tora]